jgi:release factor glutamine methyltransferase
MKKKIKDILKEYQIILQKQMNDYSQEEIKIMLEWAAMYIFQISKNQILLNEEVNISNEWQKFIEKIQEKYPIQYFLGEAYFFKEKFFVNESVLIPRPETEIMIEKILQKYDKNLKINVLDLGTGSGCLPIIIKKYFPNAFVVAIDIEEKALEIAQKNANLHQTTIEFYKQDMLVPKNLGYEWDIIISNPPYICENEKKSMRENVLKYEPHTALFVPNENPLIFYKAIQEWSTLFLKKGGEIYAEINENLAKETLQLFDNEYFNNQIIFQDYFSKDRILKAEKK